MNYFNLDIKKLSVELLPTCLCKPTTIAFLFVIIAPLITIYLAFKRYRNKTNYAIKHNGQSFSLRKVLNDNFDPFKRRIKVINIDSKSPLYIHTMGESIKKYINTQQEIDEDVNSTFIYTDMEVNLKKKYDFIVIIPYDIYSAEMVNTDNGERFYKIENIINTYKLVSKQYLILKEQI